MWSRCFVGLFVVGDGYTQIPNDQSAPSLPRGRYLFYNADLDVVDDGIIY